MRINKRPCSAYSADIPLPDFFGSAARCCPVVSLHCSGYTTVLWEFCNQASISSFLLPVANPLYILLSFKWSVACTHLNNKRNTAFTYIAIIYYISRSFCGSIFPVIFHLTNTKISHEVSMLLMSMLLPFALTHLKMSSFYCCLWKLFVRYRVLHGQFLISLKMFFFKIQTYIYMVAISHAMPGKTVEPIEL